jgi:hypothetical protein
MIRTLANIEIGDIDDNMTNIVLGYRRELGAAAKPAA